MALTLGRANLPIKMFAQKVSVDATGNGIDFHGMKTLVRAFRSHLMPTLRELTLRAGRESCLCVCARRHPRWWLSHNILQDDTEECAAILSLRSATFVDLR
jgi:hypothetical protein